MRLYDGAPIVCSSDSVHNHRADFRRKNFVLFLQHCKQRALEETTNIQDIYAEEAKRDPVSAAMISSYNLIQRMMRARKHTTKYYPTVEDQSEFVQACTSTHTSTEVPPSELVNEDSCSQDVDICDNIQAETVFGESSDEDQDQESEAIEKAISQLVHEPEDEKKLKEQQERGPVPEDQLEAAEMLPGIRPNSTMYHDGRGYYYVFNTMRENVWYLRCIEPQCRVRAHMMPGDNSPVVQSANTLHNHRPDYKRKQFVLWMEHTKHRAATEDLPIPTIYAEEAARDPESASLISAENMKTRMHRARKSNNFKMDFGEGEIGSAEEAVEEQEQSEVKMKQENVSIEKDVVQTAQEGAEEQQTFESLEDSNTVYLYHQPPVKTSTTQKPTFYDDKGYCYQQTTIRSLVRYLKCIEPTCKARASMHLEEESSIMLNKQCSYHNHEPDSSEITMLLDPDGQLVSADNTPIQVIYTDENGGEQVALCHIAETPTPRKRPYKQRQMPELTIDPDEPVDTNLSSEVDVAAGDYYHNEDQQRYPLRPSEVIPGLRPDANNYHDGNGFYYELNRLSQNIRYLKCLIKDCKARAYMDTLKKNAPIIQTNFARHNHGPDLFRKQFTVFLHRVTRRAAMEDTPINVIYQQEAERDPQSASQIRMENVKQRMMRFRKKHRKANNTDVGEEKGEGGVYHLVEGDLGESYYIQYGEGEGEEEAGVEGEPYLGQYEGHEDDEADETSMYQGYVVSEVEVESSQQHQFGSA
ncbi:uncharacterized protein LOC124366306 [Homalodisca vitripennis]|uniref:uncharacterized protein LOC124366306 n=1 Tax=Homalodisca vitripennis TaxID=197043 RepID=UPI001EECEE0A|nr:uncharacterized protein LOC124366306 [Homalodisca vitripennis]